MQGNSKTGSNRSFFRLPALLLLGFLVLGCVDERTGTEDERPAQVCISFRTGDFPQENILRSAVSPAEENKVHNLYLFVFGSDGIVRTRKFCPYDALAGKPAGLDAENAVTMQTLSGNKEIYMVANIDDKAPLANITKAQLDAITTKSELANLIVGYRNGTGSLMRTDGKLLMGGKIPYEIKSGQTNQVTVPLRRVCSKVQFTVKSGNANLTFTPISWRVVKMPLKVRLFAGGEEDTNGGVNQNNEFFESTARVFEQTTGAGSTQESSFIFYQYENRKTAKKPNPEPNTAKAFHLREKQLKTPQADGSVNNGAFEYADDNASYVVIEGDISITNGTEITQARVQYTIHLGYLNANPDDFNCLRNTFYKYTVTINGVNKIQVEAQATSANVEENPGAEGAVIRATTSYTFDSHYATCIVKVPRTILNMPKPFYVNTPFDTYGTTDINWIKFMKNPAGSETTIALYPGETNPGLLNPQQMLNRIRQAVTNNESNFFVTEGGIQYAYFTVFINEFYYDKDPMNPTAAADPTLWKQFVNKLPREFVMPLSFKLSPDKKSSYADGAYIIRQESIKTTYSLASQNAAGFEVMDENFGEEYTADTGNNRGNTDGLDGWKNSCLDWDLVSADPRVEASWSGMPSNRKWDNFVNFKEIVPQNAYGWGTYKLVKNGTTNPKAAGTTTSTARYACLARNRDINGNGYIDKTEVRWYLAAVDQLINIWIGSVSVKRDHQLYRTPEYYRNLGRVPYVLYFTSTRYNGAPTDRNNPTILWSKEGTSTSGFLQPLGSNWLPGLDASGNLLPPPASGQPTYGNLNRKQFYTRCIRNLGTADPSVQPGATVSWDATNRVISLVDPTQTSWVDPANYRDTGVDYIAHELEAHTERDPQNMPAKKFKVATSFLYGGNTYTWNYLRGGVIPSPHSCQAYFENGDQSDKGLWRMPNQRELQLMARRGVIGNDFVWAASNYTYNLALDLAGRDRAPCGCDMYGLSVQPKIESKKVRCVRDIK